MKLPRVVITDFDRTLTMLYPNGDGLQDLKHEVRKVYAACGQLDNAISEQQSEDGYVFWHALHKITEAQLDTESSLRLNNHAESVVTNFEIRRMSMLAPFSGVAESLHKIAASGRVVAIVSSNATQAIEKFLRNHQLQPYITTTIGRQQPFHPSSLKPSPEMIQLAIRRLEAKPENTAYIGDDPVDMLAAASANVLPIGVTSGRHTASQLRSSGAHLTLPGFSTLIDYL